MPIYKFHCSKCNNSYDTIVKMSQEYDKCPECGSVMKRTHCDLTNPPKLIAGIGGFHSPSYGERQVE